MIDSDGGGERGSQVLGEIDRVEGGDRGGRRCLVRLTEMEGVIGGSRVLGEIDMDVVVIGWQ